MKVEYAFICQNAVRKSQEAIDAYGIGTRRYVRIPKAPSPLPLEFDVVVLLRAEQSESGTHKFDVFVKDRKGNLLTEREARVIEAPKSSDKGPSYISVIAHMETAIQEPGRHSIPILIDDKEIHRTHFTVAAEA